MAYLTAMRMSVAIFSLCSSFTSSLLAQDWVYTTRPGDNLWDISQKYLSSMSYWRELQALNNIENPKQMSPGTRLRLPIAWLKVQPVAVRVLDVTGNVIVKSGKSGQTSGVTVDTLLNVNDEIRTEDNSSVVLLFADGSQLLLQSNSQLRLNVIRAYGETGMVDSRVRLNNGRVDTRIVPSKGPGGRFEVHTPGALSAVRGTQFRMSSDISEQVSTTEVIVGRVAVSAAGETQVIPAGFGTVVETGKPPLQAQALLPPPDLSGLGNTFYQESVTLVWPELEGARSYRLQLAPDDQFRKLFMDVNTQHSQLTFTTLADGEYAVRIHGVDELGLGGRDAVHHFNVDKRPTPPRLVKPVAHSYSVGEEVEFIWSDDKQSRRYHFQVADNTEFSQPVIDVIGHAGQKYKTEVTLPPGPYYWRVASAQEAGKYGVFSEPQNFWLRALLTSPQVEEPVVNEEQLIFHWQSDAQQQYFEYELSRDASFEELVAHGEVSKRQVIIPLPSSGQYYFRVRGADESRSVGPHSNVVRVDVSNDKVWPVYIYVLISFVIFLL